MASTAAAAADVGEAKYSYCAADEWLA